MDINEIESFEIDPNITATTGRVNLGKITGDVDAAANLKSFMDRH